MDAHVNHHYKPSNEFLIQTIFFLFQRTVFIKSEIKLNVITLIVIGFVTVYSIVRNQAKYQKCALSFPLESTKLSCYLWKLFNQIDSIQFLQVFCTK